MRADSETQLSHEATRTVAAIRAIAGAKPRTAVAAEVRARGGKDDSQVVASDATTVFILDVDSLDVGQLA